MGPDVRPDQRRGAGATGEGPGCGRGIDPERTPSGYPERADESVRRPRRVLAPAEERPGSVGQGGGQHPPGVTRGTVPQRTDRLSVPVRRGWQVRVKRWCKRPPACRVTGVARQTPPGARPDRERSRAARPSSRVGRWRRAATYVVDGWPSPARGQPRAGTEPGVSTDSSAHPPARPPIRRVHGAAIGCAASPSSELRAPSSEARGGCPAAATSPQRLARRPAAPAWSAAGRTRCPPGRPARAT